MVTGMVMSGFDAAPELEAKGWEHRGAVGPVRAQRLAPIGAPNTAKGVR